MILSCTQQFMSVLKMVKLVVLIIRIAAPVLLIIAGSRDFMSAIKDEDSDALRKAGASFVKHVANIKCRAKHQLINYSIFRLQFSSVAQSCPTTCDPMNRSTPGLPVHHQLPESTETHVH